MSLAASNVLAIDALTGQSTGMAGFSAGLRAAIAFAPRARVRQDSNNPGAPSGAQVIDFSAYRKAKNGQRFDNFIGAEVGGSRSDSSSEIARWSADFLRNRQDSRSASAGFHLAQQLEYIYEEVLREVNPELTLLQIFPVDRSVPLGASTYTLRRLYTHGRAKVHGGAGDTVPRVGLSQEEETRNIRYLVAAYAYSIFDQIAAQYAQSGLDRELIAAARRAIEELIDYLGWNGSKPFNLYGIKNYPYLNKVVLSTDFKSSSTGEDVYNALIGLVDYPVNVSKGRLRPTHIATSSRVFNFLAAKVYSDGSGGMIAKTVLQQFNEVQQSKGAAGIQGWHIADELRDFGGTDVDGILAYRKDSRGIRVVIPSGIQALPLQQVGLENTGYLFAPYGGVAMPDSLASILGLTSVDP